MREEEFSEEIKQKIAEFHREKDERDWYENWKQKMIEKYHLTLPVANSFHMMFLIAQYEKEEIAQKLIKRYQREEAEEGQEIQNAYLKAYIDAFYDIMNVTNERTFTMFDCHL